jgi:ACT domain-containing protein
MKTEHEYDALFEALVEIKNNLAEKIGSLEEHIRRAQLECIENAFQNQKDALAECLDMIDQQLITLSVYLEEHQRLCASLNNLNKTIPGLGGAPLTMPEALAGDSLATVLAGRLDYLKSQGKISGR